MADAAVRLPIPQGTLLSLCGEAAVHGQRDPGDERGAAEARNSATSATSAGVASLPSGCSADSRRAGLIARGEAGQHRRVDEPGQSALTRMPSAAQSSASARASWTAAPLVAT